VRLSAIEREGEIEIAVSDTGIGIPEEAQRRLFERFHRAAAVRRREGTGIGLALVKTLVEAEGGRITVESRVGAGTTFRVFLPLRPVMEAEAPAGAPGSHAAAESRPPEPQGPRAHMAAREAPLGRGPNAILVVEDDPELAEFLVSLLARRYRVRWAADGIEALEMARAAPPDLIVTDVAMPRMDGLALTRAAKRDELLAGVPVLILSAHADVADFIAGYEAGAVDYLGKPFAPDVLESKVSALLKIRLLQQSLVARERLAAVGQVTITLSHEVNNALTAILGSAQTLENEVLSDEARASVRAIEVGATRIAETLKKLGALRDAKPATYVGATKMIAID
jgi:signal transduction histidine kinase